MVCDLTRRMEQDLRLYGDPGPITGERAARERAIEAACALATETGDTYIGEDVGRAYTLRAVSTGRIVYATGYAA